MRTGTVVAMVGLTVGAIAPTSASAAPVTGCSSGALRVCAAFDAWTALVGTGSQAKWHLYIRAWNLYDGTAANGLSNVITFVGIGSSWQGTASLASAKYNGNAVTQWGQANNINNNVVGSQLAMASLTNGVDYGLVGCVTPSRSSQLRTCYPNAPELDLDFVTSSQFTVANAVFGWHAQAISQGNCSLWANTNGQSTADNSAGCGGSVVPEPVSITLLATGLAGVGGLGLLRRRRRGVEGDRGVG